MTTVIVFRSRFTTEGVLASEGTPMYVLTEEEGRWLTANQNTLVLAE